MAGGRSSDITNLKKAKASIAFVFNEAAKQPLEKQYPQIVHLVQEDLEVGTYLTAGDIGNATTHVEGAAYTYEGISEDWKTEITIATKGKGVFATRKQMRDDQTLTVKGMFGAKLIKAMNMVKEQYCADLYSDGFAASMADGVYVFSNTHPLSNCGSKYNDNLITGAITADNIKAGINKFVTIYDQAGNPFGSKATHLLANTMQQFTIFEVLNSQLLAYELSNTINSLKSRALGVILNDFIDHTDKGDSYSPWFMLDWTMDDAGAILQYRGGMNLESWQDNDTKDMKATCEEEYAGAFVSPGYAIIGSQNS